MISEKREHSKHKAHRKGKLVEEEEEIWGIPHKEDNNEHYEHGGEDDSNGHSLSPLIEAHNFFENNEVSEHGEKENKKKKKKKKKKNREDDPEGENPRMDVKGPSYEINEWGEVKREEHQLGSHDQQEERQRRKEEKRRLKEEKKRLKEELITHPPPTKQPLTGRKKKSVRFQHEEVSNEEILNYFIQSYEDKISIEHDELCQVMTGKKFLDIERLAKNATEITHQSLMLKNIQKEQQNYCRQCGYIYNYDDYMYMYMKRFNLSKSRERSNCLNGRSPYGPFTGAMENANFDNENAIKCIYCGAVIDTIEMYNHWNGKENYIELNSYREKYIFDKNKKSYWKNKITSLEKNVSLFKEDQNQAYNITYEKCTDCGNDFLHFINIQTRSADEGSTIIYFCPNCKKQTTVNN
ncbi:hypothetical protein C922_04537 [Plasmodium inui San Antonio 1]|uniref:TFIIS-type domain-containing protein n=1 Tax=Plasmodium inui San Antonio 1 TaxID=1237626 RepID=W7AIB9_9APIC|nr:hypothetical protein C922_04537 [Plasmodium inui San Antonio 1]EUD65026.1 hypothetical protein C922_04537 [Plasmodium inui San Antonio 1]